MHLPYRPALAASALLVPLTIASLLAPMTLAQSPAMGAEPVRIGVYHNPPKIQLGEDGEPSGIFGDLAQALAEENGWQLTPVECAWQRCLAMLEAGELDLMPDVAWTQARAARFAFHQEPVLHSWSQLYHRSPLALEGVLDLEGLRIAVMEDSMQQHTMAQMLESFGIDAELVALPGFQEGFASVQQGTTDAVVSNHLFGGWQAARYGLTASPIMFEPSRLFFAAPPGRHAALLERIDAQLASWKRRPSSPYYQALESWRSVGKGRLQVPRWLRWTLIGSIALMGLAMLGNLTLRRRLRDHLTAIRQVREDNRRLRLYDSLTGLPNRRHLMEQLHRRLAMPHAPHDYSALLLIDLDRFKRVNETRSHREGDELLFQLSEQFEKVLGGATAFLAHLGADEFAVLVDDLGPRADQAAQRVERLGDRLLSAIVAAQTPAVADLGITGSIGVSLFDGEASSPDTALQQADIAVSQAKAAAGNRLRFFDDAVQAAVNRQVRLEADLRRALQRDELRLFYQVQVDERGEVSGREALLRWAHPQQGMVSPGEFIPLAEETGLIVPIGRWVMESACRRLAEWATEPALAGQAISVNVSPVQFSEEDFVPGLKEILAATGASPRRLVLEVTESLLMQNPECVSQRLSELRDLGVRLALDDFGTGYSSLSYLKRLSLNELKIDASFVAGIPDDPADMAIVDTILTLANRLGLEVTAEGVETDEQHRWLQARGCRRFQGFLFGRPEPQPPLGSDPKVH